MSKPTLVLMMGLPRSGKTTWAIRQGRPIVSPDAVRVALHSQRFVAEAEPMVWALTKYMVKALFLAGHKVVILDATNTTRKRRDAWIDDQWVRAVVQICTSASVCLGRALEEEDEAIKPVISRMAEEFEPVNPEEEDFVSSHTFSGVDTEY